MKNAVDDQLKKVTQKIASSEAVVVLTGAGISAESGIPTFRGEDGLWKKHRAEDLATPEAFQRNPQLVWEWYQWRRGIIAAKKANPAHEALTLLESSIRQFLLITQNVDGLHGRAGSRKMIEMHGNIWKMWCTVCGEKMENHALDLPPLPQCVKCEGLLRPDIVWFGEAIQSGHLEQSIQACQNSDTMLVIGTSGVVQPAASFASIAKESGAYVVEINPKPYLLDIADVTLSGKAAELLPKII